jgi:N-methylhydantoinase A
VPEGRFDAGTATSVADRFHAEHRALYGYDFAADPGQQVEWVNLRVSGIGPIQRPEIRRHERPGGFETGASAPSSTTGREFERGASAPSSTTGSGSVVEEVAQQPSRNHVTRPVCFDAADGYVPTAIVQRGELPPGASLTGPAIIEEYGSTVPVHPGFEVRVDDYLNLIVTRQQERA